MATKGREITLSDLEKIVKEAGAPPLVDSFNARCVVVSVNALIRNRHIKPVKPPASLEKCREALGQLSKHLPDIVKRYEAHEASLLFHDEKRITAVIDAAIEAGEACREDRSEHIRQLMEASEDNEAVKQSDRVKRPMAEIEDVRPAIQFHASRRGRGDSPTPYQQLEMVLRRIYWAWGADGNKQVSQALARQVLRKLADLAGCSCEDDALRKAIDSKPAEFLPFDHRQRVANRAAATEERAILGASKTKTFLDNKEIIKPS